MNQNSNTGEAQTEAAVADSVQRRVMPPRFHVQRVGSCWGILDRETRHKPGIGTFQTVYVVLKKSSAKKWADILNRRHNVKLCHSRDDAAKAGHNQKEQNAK